MGVPEVVHVCSGKLKKVRGIGFSFDYSVTDCRMCSNVAAITFDTGGLGKPQGHPGASGRWIWSNKIEKQLWLGIAPIA